LAELFEEWQAHAMSQHDSIDERRQRRTAGT
jgi:hypothetical protein